MLHGTNDSTDGLAVDFLASVSRHETLTPAKLLGCGLVTAGLLVIARGQ